MHEQRNRSASTNHWMMAASIIVLFLGAILSRLVEPGVRVEKVTLAGGTPALKFIPTGEGPHPVALLAHGFASSKEAFFRFGEALAAAGFVCYSVDQPGHGASPIPLTFMAAVDTFEAVAREVGPIDVFVGWSMGGGTGGEAVRLGRVKPKLFIAVGFLPVLGDHGPPLLLLAGKFEEAFPPAVLKTRTDARLIISPWSDHLLEGFDPVLVNAAVEAACASADKTPPSPPTAWLWRLLGVVLAMLAAGALAGCLTNLFSQLARFRGLLIGTFIAAAFLLTVGGRWFEATPHFRSQVIALPVILLIAIIAGKLRIPCWSFVALCVVAAVISILWHNATLSQPALIFMAAVLVLFPFLIAGLVIHWFASRHAARLQGDIAMAIFLGCAPFQCLELPRTAPPPALRKAITLDAKFLDACLGEYEFPPDNGYWLPWKMTIRRQGDRLSNEITSEKVNLAPVEIHAESETNFFGTAHGSFELTFVKNDKGEATLAIWRSPGGPVREGKKVAVK